MRRILVIGLTAVVLLVALAAALPFLIPLSAYKSEIEARASAATGRAVRIDGPLRLSFWPVIGVRAEQVRIAALPGNAERDLAQARALDVAIAPRPLLDREVQVSEFLLEQPTIYLEVDKTGAANWVLRGNTKPPGGARKVSVTRLRIENGALSYFDARTGRKRALANLDADVTMQQAGTLFAQGRFQEKGRDIAFAAWTGDVPALERGEIAPVHVTLKSDLFQLDFAGRAARGGDADGALKLDTSSLRDMAAALDHPLSASTGLGKFSLRTTLSARDNVYTLSHLAFALNSTNANGELAIDTSGAVPAIKGALAVERFDLNPYLGAAAAAGQQQHAGWSRTPIVLAALKQGNADLMLSAGQLTVRNLKIANATVAVTLANGKLDATLDKVALYGGAGQASVQVDASGPVPVIASHLTFVNMAMRPFLTDTLGVSKIEGTGNIKLDIAGRGTSAFDIMHGLSGTGAVAIGSGVIHGVDLGQVARTVQTIVSGGATSEFATTTFSSFGGTFRIANGVLANRDLALSGPILTMTGAGTLDLGNRTIDFHLAPKAGIGGKAKASLGLSVPFHVTGTWDHLQYTPDLSGVVSGVIGDIEEGGAALKSLFTRPAASSRQKKDTSLGDSVKNLFGIH